MKKKILALMGSPRKNMHTNTSLDLVLNEIDPKEFTVEKIYIADLDLDHCTGCEGCGKIGKCVRSDMMIDIYSKLNESDIVILAGPIYFNSLNSLTKTLIDRCQVYWSQKYVLGQKYQGDTSRRGYFIGVGGAPFTFDQFLGATPVMDYFFRAINVNYSGNILISNTDNRLIKEDDFLVDNLKRIGSNIDKLDKFHIQL